GRIRPASGQGTALPQGPEICPAEPPGEPDPERQEGPQDPAGSQQAVEHRLPAQGVLRPVVELPARRLGTAFLRELEGQSQVATPETLRAIRRNDRASLGRDRRLLQTREQGPPWLRRGTQQQDPRHPAARLRTA